MHNSLFWRRPQDLHLPQHSLPGWNSLPPPALESPSSVHGMGQSDESVNKQEKETDIAPQPDWDSRQWELSWERFVPQSACFYDVS